MYSQGLMGAKSLELSLPECVLVKQQAFMGEAPAHKCVWGEGRRIRINTQSLVGQP
jgi:hypothetical protein